MKVPSKKSSVIDNLLHRIGSIADANHISVFAVGGFVRDRFLKKEVDGFLLNRIFGAISREALWMLEMGVATADDIDKACVYGAGHPMGPFRLMDLTGIDLNYTMSMETFKKTGDPARLPSPSVVEHYIKGEYGEKTGKGWYEYK